MRACSAQHDFTRYLIDILFNPYCQMLAEHKSIVNKLTERNDRILDNNLTFNSKVTCCYHREPTERRIGHSTADATTADARATTDRAADLD